MPGNIGVFRAKLKLKLIPDYVIKFEEDPVQTDQAFDIIKG